MRSNIKITLIISTIIFVSCKKKINDPETNHQIFRLSKKGRISTDGGLSRGVAWGDFDNDGDPDLYVANSNGQWNAFYKNDGKGQFQKMTAERNSESATISFGSNSQGVNWVDYDNDGDLDLFIVSRGEEKNLLFRNDSLVRFTKIEESELTKKGISASMACWADFDNDGDLDVFLAGYSHPNLLFRNDGNENFQPIYDTVISENEEGRSRACSCGDSNKDGLPELYIANARKSNQYFKNLGDWKFNLVKNVHEEKNIGYSYGASWADYDNDGDLDLFVANFDRENFLYQNDGLGSLLPFTDSILTIQQGGASKGHTWGDFDHDGNLDLFVANGTYAPDMRNFLFMNRGKGVFEKTIQKALEKSADTSAGAAHADIDRDGDLDVFVANWGSRDQVNTLYKNIGAKGNWITMRLKGTTSNTFGVGTQVSIYTKNNVLHRWLFPNTGYASQNDYELHFGLGDANEIDSLKIHWTLGKVDIYQNIVVNKHFQATEGKSIRVIR